MPLTATPLRLSTVDSHFEAVFQARLHWADDTDAAIETSVAAILRDVQQRGDAAVLEYTARWDHVQGPNGGRTGADPGRTEGRL
jgi:histidinol dehydrogenase